MRSSSYISALALMMLSVTAGAAESICHHPTRGDPDYQKIFLKDLQGCRQKKGIAIVKSRGCFVCYSGAQLKKSALEVPAACQTRIGANAAFKGADEKASVYVFAKKDVRAVRATLAEATSIHARNEKALSRYCKGSENTFLTVAAKYIPEACHNIGFRSSQNNSLLIGDSASDCIEYAKDRSMGNAHLGDEKRKNIPADGEATGPDTGGSSTNESGRITR